MKFNLTITDATLDELRSFLNGASTPAIVKAALAPVIVANTSATESPVEPDEALENPEGAPAFDSAGFPWDERIHSANKGTNTNGTWRKRRGVDDATITTVEAELKGRATIMTRVTESEILDMPVAVTYVTGESAVSQVIATPATVMPSGDTSESVDAPAPTPVVMTPQQFAPVTPAMPEPVAPAPTPVIGATTIDFGGFMNAVAQKSSAGIIDNAYIVSLTQRTGAAIGRQMLAITDVMTIPEGIAAAVQIMQQDGKW